MTAEIESITDLSMMHTLSDRTLVQNKQPGFAYRWVTPEKVGKHRGLGWECVKEKDPEKAPMMDFGRVDKLKGFDGYGGSGGMILMRCKEEFVVARKAAMVQQNKRRLRQDHEREIEELVRAGQLTEQQAKTLAEEGFIEERAG